MMLLRKVLTRKSFPSNQQFRNAGHWLRQNLRIDENAGIRESRYKTFEFNKDTTFDIIVYLFIPATLFYVAIVDEMKNRDKAEGNTSRKEGYGFI